MSQINANYDSMSGGGLRLQNDARHVRWASARNTNTKTDTSCFILGHPPYGMDLCLRPRSPKIIEMCKPCVASSISMQINHNLPVTNLPTFFRKSNPKTKARPPMCSKQQTTSCMSTAQKAANDKQRSGASCVKSKTHIYCTHVLFWKQRRDESPWTNHTLFTPNVLDTNFHVFFSDLECTNSQSDVWTLVLVARIRFQRANSGKFWGWERWRGECMCGALSKTWASRCSCFDWPSWLKITLWFTTWNDSILLPLLLCEWIKIARDVEAQRLENEDWLSLEEL